LVRLAKNHALADGNKRTALICMVRFCLRIGYEYVPPGDDHPDGEETFRPMAATAAATAENLEAIEAEVAGWIAERLRPSGG
jgi:prophage maintenance system killer protein